MVSIMELSEDFVDLITITFAILTILGIFLITVHYNLEAKADTSTMRAVQFSEAVMLAPCLTEESGGWPVKALFSEAKLAAESGNNKISCINAPFLRARIETSEGQTWNLGSGGSKSVKFPAAVKMTDGRVLPATLEAWI